MSRLHALVIRGLLRLYPRAWRERYGEEFAALLAARPRTLATALDVVLGALDAHWRQEASMRPTLRRATPILAGLLVLILGAGAMRAVGTSMSRWVFARLGWETFLVGFGPPPSLPILGWPEVVIIAVAMVLVVATPARRLSDARKIGGVGLLCLAAIVTPTPDPVMLAYVFFPLYLMFELALRLTHRTRPWRRTHA